MKNNNVRAISVRTRTGCELVEEKADRADIDIPSERQLRSQRVEQMIRYDRARMAARLNGARMAEYLPREVTPAPALYAPEPKGGIWIELAKAWVRLWGR